MSNKYDVLMEKIFSK